MIIRKKDPISRFLLYSFTGLLLFSILVFIFLGFYMNRESEKTIYEVGDIYMSGMNEKISKNFENVIQFRFDQVYGITSVVSPDNYNKQDLYKELTYRAEVRNFDYLALCSEEGEFETLMGESIKPFDTLNFVEALKSKEDQIMIGTDVAENEIVLFAVQAEYPMQNGGESIGLVAAVPLEYITDTLSLEDDGQLMYYHIVRRDGSVIIRNPNSVLWEHFSPSQPSESIVRSAEEDTFIKEFSTALREKVPYTSTLEIDGIKQQIYGSPLSYSEWYLVGVMPYGTLDQAINNLSAQRLTISLLAYSSILILLALVFFRYYRMTHRQIHELDELRKAALEASRTKSEFLANMSHDIRTPMNAIVGMTAIATAHIDNQEQVQNCLKKITLSSKHLLGLINDVLDMSKIESGKLTLTSEQISLKEVVEGAVGIIQPQVKSKKQKFNVCVENILAENVWCDGVRLNQVLLNLLSNATKYTPEGGSIQFTLREENSPKGEDFVQVHIYVKDNGIGMSQEYLGRIYESYSRADGARVHKTEGAGLGMAITKYIVDAMDGHIDIQSEPGKGTEFHVTVDFKKAGTIEADMVLPPWNMLIVDDDEFLCQTATNELKSIGINAEWTLSGEKAIELTLQRHQRGDDYQIVLLDWKLPGLNGIQVAKEIRHNLGNEIPILLISAYDWSDFEAEAREAGINGFISKPLFKSTLFYGLRQYMGGGESEKTTPDQNINLSGCRILLAEDNELNWEVANELLSDLGVELEWAENGRICLDKFQESPQGYYDAILMDIRMPHMTGYEATTAIRSMDRPDALSIPIIAMSADAFSSDIQHCLDCGMNAHIAKPIDVTELARLMKRYLNK